MDNIYELLTSLPLFKGASYDSITELAGKTKLHFKKYNAGDVIADVGAPCDSIVFLISGTVRSTIESRDGCFAISQTLVSPEVIAPEFLFGKAPFYPCKVVAKESTGILEIAKTDFLQLLEIDKVFLLNFLNILSLTAQRAVKGVISRTDGSLIKRIAYRIICMTQQGGQDIQLTCQPGSMHIVFNVTSNELINALNAMKSCDILDFTPGCISIHSRRSLLDILIND